MRNYLLFIPAILTLTSCASCFQDTDSSDKLVVAQLCTILPAEKAKEITLQPLELFKGNIDATENMNSLILPTQPIVMKFVGVSPNNMAIYSGVAGNAQSLRYVNIIKDKEYMSFKRDFTKYNDQWGKWEASDESGLKSYTPNKVRFKNMSYQMIFTNIIPDSCD